MFFLCIQDSEDEVKQPKASTTTVLFSESDISQICVQLVREELSSHDSDDTVDLVANETLGKSGEIIAFCVALAKAIVSGKLSDENLLKAHEAVQQCATLFEDFATLRRTQ